MDKIQTKKKRGRPRKITPVSNTTLPPSSPLTKKSTQNPVSDFSESGPPTKLAKKNLADSPLAPSPQQNLITVSVMSPLSLTDILALILSNKKNI
jgi:hypothetical protein